MKFIKSILFGILSVIFPISAISGLLNSIKDLKSFNFWDSNLGWCIKLYSLTLCIPITATTFLLIGTILGLITKPFFTVLYDIWIGYYFTGSFIDVIAWRWHLVLFILSFIFVISEKD